MSSDDANAARGRHGILENPLAHLGQMLPQADRDYLWGDMLKGRERLTASTLAFWSSASSTWLFSGWLPEPLPALTGTTNTLERRSWCPDQTGENIDGYLGSESDRFHALGASFERADRKCALRRLVGMAWD